MSNFRTYFYEIYKVTPQTKKMTDGAKDVKITPDADGNGDDVFKASNIKVVNRKAERHGHGPLGYGVSESENLDELSSKTLKSYIKKADRAGDKAWEKSSSEEDKAMSTDGEKYPEKQQRHIDNAKKYTQIWRKREKGRVQAREKLGNLPK